MKKRFGLEKVFSNRFILLCCILLLSVFHSECVENYLPQYYVTVADTEHFECLLSLIGSIHKTNFNHLAEIAVYDLGLSPSNKLQLEGIMKVKIYPVQKVHPDLFKKFKTRKGGKWVRGWYAWKGVVIKQALERFEYILYIDAGSLVLRPLDDLFEYIKTNDYFLVSNNHTLRNWTTQFVKDKYDLESVERSYILDNFSMTAGLQGLTCNMLPEYIIPVAERAKDMRYFTDDGSAGQGFGYARHDQCIFTIHARLLGLELFSQINEKGGIIPLQLPHKKSSAYVTWDKRWVDENTQIRLQSKKSGLFSEYIRFK